MPNNVMTRPGAEPNLSDLLNYFTKDIMLSLNCHALATIQRFDPDARTVKATINYTKTQIIKQSDSTYKNQEIQYPTLIDVPVICLGGGKGSLTFPIQKGDQALILFNDRDIDNWFSSSKPGPVNPVNTSRLHSLSDGLALVGLNDIADYDEDRVVLKKDDAKVAIGNSLIEISNNITTLNTVLQDILTQLETLANTPAVNGSPINPSVATALVTLGTTLGELLV